MTTEQEINYIPSWECKLGNVIVKSAPNSASILNVPINKGDHVICTITNVKKSFNQTVTIIKKTVPASTGVLFSFQFFKGSSLKKIVKLTHLGKEDITVEAGKTYRIKEILNTSYPVSSYSCKYIPTSPLYKPFSADSRETPNFLVPKGYDVECTFTNCTNGLLCPLHGDPNDPGKIVGGGSTLGGGGNQ